MGKTISVDFDGTIVKEAYPEIGELIPNAKEVITRLYMNGNDIIINTCRSGVFEGEAELFLMKNEIPFNYINNNLPEKIERYGRDCRKISADLYIDNKNLLHESDWLEIEKILAEKHGIYSTDTQPEDTSAFTEVLFTDRSED